MENCFPKIKMPKSSKQDIINHLVDSNVKLQEKLVDMVNSINKLTKRIDTMVEIFEEAAKNVKTDSNEPLRRKLEELLEQNKNIARGLILLEKYVRDKSSFSNLPPKPLPQSNL